MKTKKLIPIIICIGVALAVSVPLFLSVTSNIEGSALVGDETMGRADVETVEIGKTDISAELTVVEVQAPVQSPSQCQPRPPSFGLIHGSNGKIKDIDLIPITSTEVPVHTPEPTSTPEPTAEPTPKYYSYYEQMVQVVNAERKKMGAGKLVMDEQLSEMAGTRAEEASNNWSHTRPDGRKFRTIFDDYGVEGYIICGENLARGYKSASDVVAAWMESESHRSNLLFNEFTRAGVGVYESSDGKLYVSMIFSGK